MFNNNSYNKSKRVKERRKNFNVIRKIPEQEFGIWEQSILSLMQEGFVMNNNPSIYLTQ